MSFITDDFLKNLLSSQGKICHILRWNAVAPDLDQMYGNCSNITRVSITYMENGKECEKYLLLKIPYTCALYETTKPTGLYEKEIYMYQTVLPRLHELLGEDILAPMFYGTDGNHAIILEDISKLGYRTCQRHESLDFEHCVKAIKHLAKLHATSLKLNLVSPDVLEGAKTDSLITRTLQVEEMKKSFSDRLMSVLQIILPNTVEKWKVELEQYKNQFIDLVVQDMVCQREEFNVLSHADAWSNNFMFQYDPRGEIENIKFVDFQLSHWASPVLDIFYFLITCGTFEMFEKYVDLLLEIYLGTLHRTCQYLQCSCSYSLNDLQVDIEKKCNYPILVTIYILVISYASNPIEASNPQDVKCLQNEKYKTVAKKWLLHFLKKIKHFKNITE